MIAENKYAKKILHHGAGTLKAVGDLAIGNHSERKTVAVPFSFQPFWLYEKPKPKRTIINFERR